MTTHRIEALTDGIFAIAMTLLVLNLALPEPGQDIGETGLHHLLFRQKDKFISYALSFVLLAIFWIKHHQQFHFITRTDGKHLSINVFFLMFVALVPFSTSLIGDYSDELLAGVFFGSNIFILAILLSWNWAYATEGHRLVEPSLDPQRIALGKKRGALTVLVPVLAMGLALVDPQISSCAYLLIPILHVALEHQHQKMTRGPV